MVAGCAGEVYRADIPLPEEGCYYPPTLITGLEPGRSADAGGDLRPGSGGHHLPHAGRGGELANNTRYGLAASVWTENVNLALDIAPKLAAGVVWVNATNLFDAAAGFGGVRESGFGREGGWEGWPPTPAQGMKPSRWPDHRLPAMETAKVEGLDRTAKLYIGGKQARPDGGYSRAVWAEVGAAAGPCRDRQPQGSAQRGRGGGGRGGLGADPGPSARADPVLHGREPRGARRRIRRPDPRLTGQAAKARRGRGLCPRLFTYAAWADKHRRRGQGRADRGIALAMNEPVGVIGAFCPDEAPLLGLVSVMAPIMAMGNRSVLVASEPFPLAATDFYQVLETSDVPAGVVNILTGPHAELAPQLAGTCRRRRGLELFLRRAFRVIEREAAGNLKRTWVNNGRARDWMSPEGEGRAFLAAATEIKTIWVPYGRPAHAWWPPPRRC
jgi:aldehyde dehydrogenase (NAD+)